MNIEKTPVKIFSNCTLFWTGFPRDFGRFWYWKLSSKKSNILPWSNSFNALQYARNVRRLGEGEGGGITVVLAIESHVGDRSVPVLLMLQLESYPG